MHAGVIMFCDGELTAGTGCKFAGVNRYTLTAEIGVIRGKVISATDISTGRYSTFINEPFAV
jgi:hypothetical protein